MEWQGVVRCSPSGLPSPRSRKQGRGLGPRRSSAGPGTRALHPRRWPAYGTAPRSGRSSVVSLIYLYNRQGAGVGCWVYVQTCPRSLGRRESREALEVPRGLGEDAAEDRAPRAHHPPGWRGGTESRDCRSPGRQPADGPALARPLPAVRRAGADEGRAAAGAEEGRDPGADQAGGGGHAADDSPGGDPLDHPHDGPGAGAVAHDGAAHLEAARPTASPGRDLQAVSGSPFRGEAPRRGGPLLGSPGQGPGPVGGREEPDPGAGPHGPAVAAASRDPGPSNTGLHSPWDGRCWPR